MSGKNASGKCYDRIYKLGLIKRCVETHFHVSYIFLRDRNVFNNILTYFKRIHINYNLPGDGYSIIEDNRTLSHSI